MNETEKKIEDPQAFPDAGWGNGMTLRDYFAAKAIPAAMQLWLESNEDIRKAYSGCVDIRTIVGRDLGPFIAKISLMIADAQIAARKAVR